MTSPTALALARELLAALSNPEAAAEWDVCETGEGWFAQYVARHTGDLIEQVGPCKSAVAAAGAAMDKVQSWDHAAQAAKIRALDRAYMDACRELRLYVAASRYRQGEPGVVRLTAELDRAAKDAAERLLDAMRGE